MRKLLSILLLCSAMMTLAVPAKRGAIQVYQPDGTPLTITIHGDENFAWRQTADGYEVVQNAKKQWVYAQYDEAHRRLPSARIARNAETRSADDQQFVQQQRVRQATARAAARQQRKVRRIATPAPSVQNGTLTRAALDPDSKKKGLCLLVQFSDIKFQAAHTNTLLTRMMNETGFTYKEQKGSVRDYFYANSQQTYEPNFTVIGPITLSKPMAYYGTNLTDFGDDNFGDLLKEILVASTFAGTDLTLFDQNNDGYIDQVYIIYAGYAESSGAAAETIWPHSADVSVWKKNIGKLQNLSFGSYACSSELNGANTITDLNGIGVVCHEFSHVLGLADMYDTSGNDPSYFGVDEWDLMDFGSYCNDGYTPCNLNAWERFQLGWLNVRDLSTPQQVTLKSLDKENDGIILTSSKPNEYYILENRQLTGWDAYLSAPGMLIYHVDFNQQVWDENIVNNDAKHPYFQLKPADNQLSNTPTSLKGDPFPGSKNNRSFTDTSTPYASLWNGSTLGKPITNITQAADGSITFTLMGGMAAPVALPATNASAAGFTAHWQTVPGATDYALTVYTKQVQSGVATSETEPFASAGTTLAGWTKTANASYTSSGNFGAQSPSVKMDGTGQYIQTRLYPSPITAFQCWTKGQGTSNTSSSLKIEGYNGATWSTVKTLTNGNGFTNSKEATFALTPADLAPGYLQLKMTYTKGIGNLAVDDIKVTYGGSAATLTPVAGYDNLRTGNVASYNVAGLTSLDYYYTVVAHSANAHSEASNEITVNLTGSSVEDAPTTFRLFVNNGAVHFDGELYGMTASLYNLAGNLLSSYTLSGTSYHIPLTQRGIYIVRVDGKSYKIKY